LETRFITPELETDGCGTGELVSIMEQSSPPAPDDGEPPTAEEVEEGTGDEGIGDDGTNVAGTGVEETAEGGSEDSPGQGTSEGSKDDDEGDGTEEGTDDDPVEFEPFPVMPPCAPVASILLKASLWVSQVMLVPALFTRGRAKHDVPPEHWDTSQAPLTHCAKPPCTQACSPSVHESVVFKVAN